jgi:putative heme-binding domain-containing protein
MSRSTPAASLTALFLSACALAPAAPSADTPRTGEIRPFDGRTLAGWEGDARFWRVEDGAIVGESTPASPCAETTYLAWRGGQLGDFALELEWRFPACAGNSGVQVRSEARAPTRVAGYQADLECGPDWTGGLYEQDGRGVVTRRGERVVLGADGTRTAERFADGAALLAGLDPTRWNHLRVVAFGARLTIEVNGALFSETIDLDPRRAARRGALALQLHAGPPMRVEFRDLCLTELATKPEASTARASAAPRWIWHAREPRAGETAWFRRRFTLAAVPTRAELWIAADNHFDAWLAGQGVASGDDWAHPVRLDVSSALRVGENELLVRASNDGGPAGLVLALEAELADGTEGRVISDAAFEVASAPDVELAAPELGPWLDERASWETAHELGALGAAPWGELGAALGDDGQAPEAASIHVPPGFTVERLYSVPLASQGSWVALALDLQGRILASDQYGGLHRVTLVDGRAAVEPLALELGEAHGLLWAFDALYAVVSGAGRHASGLYRARDADGDGELDTVELLRAFAGDGEHGPHGLVLHPDGRSLLIVGGNHTALPAPFTRSRVPAHYAEDVLLAPLDDPGGHALGIRAPGGWVVRTDPDGAAWELVAAGLRNAYDLAVSPEGELLTYDSDMEWDVGLPWYRPTRVVHLVSGADFGWRAGSAKWPADHFDSLPAAVELALGSPTGLAFGHATAFPAPWNEALFACDWAYGRIHAVFLEPDGASYRGRHEVFASGEPFAVTDLVVGLDGALFVSVGGRRTQSGLYRIAWAGSAAEPSAPIADAGADARARRRALERLHGAPSLLDAGEVAPAAPEAVARALAELGDPDRFVRHAARVALEHQDPASWEAAVRAEREPRRALEGWLARVRSTPPPPAADPLEAALSVFAAADDPQLRLDALRLVGLVLLRLEVGAAERERARVALDGAYPSVDARLDRALLELLVGLGADVTTRALEALERAASQEEHIAILYALRAHLGPWREAEARRLLAAFERELARAQGGASVRGYLEAMRAEACARLDPALVASMPEPLRGASDTGTASAPRSAHAWTLAELEVHLDELTAGRDFARGREAYAAASCDRCHRLAGEGANLGPDLGGLAGRFSPRDLVLALLEPSREVPDVWRDLELWGEDRLLAVGWLESERDGLLVVREPSGTSVAVEAALVDAREPHALSRMPEGLLDPLTLDEVLDLLAYVLAGGDPASARFR